MSQDYQEQIPLNARTPVILFTISSAFIKDCPMNNATGHILTMQEDNYNFYMLSKTQNYLSFFIQKFIKTCDM